MSRPRSWPRSRGLAPPAAFLAAIVIMGAVGAVVLGVVTLSTSYRAPVAGSVGHLSSAQCSRIESASNLTAGIVHLYNGNGNQTGAGSGLIYQSPPGPTAYPSEATAITNVVSGWNSVCTSTAFYGLEQRWGAQNSSWSGLAQNSTGIYEYVITIGWQASLTQCSPNYGECLGSSQWLVNVASGAVSGPSIAYVSPQPAL